MAALALAVGACLVQTRFSKRKLPYIDSTMGVATFGGIASRTYVALRPSSIQAMRRGSPTPPRCVVQERSAASFML